MRIETDAAAERVVEFAHRADATCFASNTLANAGVVLTTRLTVNGVVAATTVRDAKLR